MSRLTNLVLAVLMVAAFSTQVSPVQAQCWDAQGRNCTEVAATATAATSPQLVGVEEPSQDLEPWAKIMIAGIFLFGLAVCVLCVMPR